MQVSEQWLREWVNPPADTSQLAESLSMLGLEVDAVTTAAADFSGVVVAEVLTCEQHPDADRLRVCTVAFGAGQPLQVVCGAPNVRKGLKVAFIQVGGVLPDGLKIKKSRLRGVESSGMICSARELGLSDEREGILELPDDAPIGQDFRDYCRLNDHIFHIDLTPNRGDCASVQGVARDLAAKFDVKITPPSIVQSETSYPSNDAVTLAAPEACPRYCSCIIRGIARDAQTPLWMRERLRRSGLRTVHPVVDIGNYVMLALGQPLHAFDFNQLQGNLNVRFASTGEQLTLLDGKTVTLNTGNLVIADAQQVQALAGIMGGAAAAVNENTETVFLESAYFDAASITRTVRQVNVSTDASFRFERGVDVTLQDRALHYFIQLVGDICGGKASQVMENRSADYLPVPTTIHLRISQIKRILGVALSTDAITAILHRLDCQVEASTSGLLVKPPAYRCDLRIESDLLEELIRIHGYDKLPPGDIAGRFSSKPVSPKRLPYLWLPRLLADLGYHEAINYSFIPPELQQQITPAMQPLSLVNPLARELSVMRTSLWPGLLQSLQYNRNRQCTRVRLFEIGLCFLPGQNGLQQIERVAAVAAGERYPLHWSQPDDLIDFFDLKGDVQQIFARLQREHVCEWRKSANAALHPGQAADLLIEGKCVGAVGALHPEITRSLGLDITPFLFELNTAALNEQKPASYENISKFPAICRDLAIVIDEGISAQRIENCIRQSAGRLLSELKLFDIYQGEGIGAGKKSIALGLIFQDPAATLIDDTVNNIIARVVADLQQTYNATMRV